MRSWFSVVLSILKSEAVRLVQPRRPALRPIRFDTDPRDPAGAHARLMRQIEDGRSSGAF